MQYYPSLLGVTFGGSSPPGLETPPRLPAAAGMSISSVGPNCLVVLVVVVVLVAVAREIWLPCRALQRNNTQLARSHCRASGQASTSSRDTTGPTNERTIDLKV